MSVGLDNMLDDRLELLPLGIDDFSALRHLHATSLRSHTIGVLSDAEVEAFAKFVYSPAYTAILIKEEICGAWLDGELLGTVSWLANATNGLTVRIGSIFVRHPRHGIGRRLLAEVEARAHQGGFSRVAAGVPASAVPFFQRLGYVVASRGVRTLSLGCALPVTFVRKDLSDPRSSTTLN
jgi:GNAT superfamily N-acetyltransferase